MRELRDRLRDTSPRATEPPESRAQLAKGQPPKGGPSASLITMHREGIKKSIHGKACEMQTTNTYLGLLRERGKQGLPLARVYRQLFNKNLYQGVRQSEESAHVEWDEKKPSQRTEEDAHQVNAVVFD